MPCLNSEAGLKVKGLKPAEVRSALCDAGLSPIGDKNELLKRLAVHYATLSGKRSKKLDHASYPLISSFVATTFMTLYQGAVKKPTMILVEIAGRCRIQTGTGPLRN